MKRFDHPSQRIGSDRFQLMLREPNHILARHCSSENNKVVMRRFERFLAKQPNSLRLAIRRYHISAGGTIATTRTTLRCPASPDAKAEVMFQRPPDVKPYWGYT